MAKTKHTQGISLKSFWPKIALPHWLLLGFLVFIGGVLRLYKIDTPLADWHSWRQADTASVTREYFKHNYSFLQPHYHDLSNIPNGLDNPEGYRMVEFPLVNWIIAQYLLAVPTANLVVSSRFASLMATLISICALYWLSWRLSKDKRIAVSSALAFAIIPYSVFYSRVILPEPFMVMMSLVSIFALVEWAENRTNSLALSLFWLLITWLSFSLALLLKPSAIFFSPVLMAIPFAYFGWQAVLFWELWILPSALLPLLGWRWWIAQFPEGIPAFSWLFNGNGIRLKPAWWRWLFADRLGRLILGYWGSIFVITGVISKSANTSRRWLLNNSSFDFITIVWLISTLAYMIVFATGNVQHDYYQIQIIPIICLLVAKGIVWLLDLKTTHRAATAVTVMAVVVLSLAFAWYEVQGYYNINNPAIVEAGAVVNELTSPDAKIIAPYGGDTAFLFQTNRTGWPVGGLIDQRIKQGATHYVSTALDDETKLLLTQYATVAQTDNFILLDLTKPATLPKDSQ